MVRKLSSRSNSESENVRIFDTFRFLNELDVLELRLNILNEWVDYFVITESRLTVSGIPKDLVFQKNKSRFKAFESKIIYNVIDEVPLSFDHLCRRQDYYTNFSDIDLNCGLPFNEIPLPYKRDMYERDHSIDPLLSSNLTMRDFDIILSSDIDEIPNPLRFKQLQRMRTDEIYIFVQLAFLYKLNLLYHKRWLGTRAVRWSYLRNSSMHQLRNQVDISKRIKRGGWHWSWLGDAEHFKEKLQAQPEISFNTIENAMSAHEKVSLRLDPFNRKLSMPRIRVGRKFPLFLRENIGRYSGLVE